MNYTIVRIIPRENNCADHRRSGEDHTLKRPLQTRRMAVMSVIPALVGIAVAVNDVIE
ncbi:MAG: hypothetical protein ACLFS5_10575 [Spirochaetaceae bacterium]